MIEYTKIGQFRNAVKTAKYRDLRKVLYLGSIKLHGTNASVVVHSNGEQEYQSRNRVLTPEDDNYDFAKFASEIDWHSRIYDVSASWKKIVIYGEWCGEGIQKGVAISELPKMFVVFDIVVDGTYLTADDLHLLLNLSDLENVSFITDYPCFVEEVDFLQPENHINHFVKYVQNVEEECPVGKSFGVSGIGEGIVWAPLDHDLKQDSSLWFKTKGDKHSSSKVKVIASVDPIRLETINKFIEYAVTEERLNQSRAAIVEQGRPLDETSIGLFISWIFKDINTEEADVIEKNNLKRKEISGRIADAARAWYFDNVLGKV